MLFYDLRIIYDRFKNYPLTIDQFNGSKFNIFIDRKPWFYPGIHISFRRGNFLIATDLLKLKWWCNSKEMEETARCRSCLFWFKLLKFADIHHKCNSIAKLRKPRNRALNIPAQKKEFNAKGHSGSLKVIYFWVNGNLMRDRKPRVYLYSHFHGVLQKTRILKHSA